MKKSILILLSCAFTFLLSAQAKEYTSTLNRVKIYTSGAEVFRTATVNLKAGTNDIVIKELSNQIDRNSIIMGTSSNATVMSTNFTIKRDYTLNNSIPEIAKLNDSIKYFQKQYTLVQNKINVLNSEADLLKQNRKLGGTNGVNFEDLEKASAFFNKRYTYIYAQTSKLNEEKQAIRQDQNRVNRKLRELRKLYPTPPSGRIVVQMSAEKAGQAKINFSYLSRGAYWFPLYEARCSELNKPISLIQKASVRQNTGETWTNVKLELSTGNPNVGVNVPNLYPRYLSFNNNKPRPIYYSNRAQTQDKKRYNEYNDEAKDDLEVSEERADATGGYMNGLSKTGYGKRSLNNYTSTSSNEVAIEYIVDRAYTLPSSSQSQLITLKTYSIEAIYNYYTVPKIDRSVYLTARLVDWQKHNLMAGQVNLFYKNSFVGKTQFQPSALNDTLRLSLGKDPKVLVTRVNQRDFTKVKNIGSNKKESLGYAISINNTNSTPIEIEVIDQIPVSKHSNIVVEVTNNGGGNYNNKTGEIKWTLNIKANKVKKLEVGYDVTSPKNKPVYGL